MSYPPYNPHEFGMNPPPPSSLSYPAYPGSAAPPPSGYSQSMPMPSSNPYPNPSPYPPQPQQSSPYPPQQSPYPPQQSPYSPQQSSYPPQQSSYPPQPMPSYPSHSPYPPQPVSGYPPQSGYSPYPPQNAPSYSSQPATFHSNQHSNNQSGGGYPHADNSHYSTPPYGTHSSQTQQQQQQQPQQSVKKGTPTLRPANPFNPRDDAAVLRKAMKGFGTDEKALIEVLANRTNAQRQEIAKEFKTLYGKDLVSDLKSETSGNFEDVLVKMMTPIPVFLAAEIHDAISGVGTDEETLIEVLCTSTNNDILILRDTYARLYGNQLEDALIGDTSGAFRRLLVSLCQGNRSENHYTEIAAAQSDAQALLRAGELRLGTDESTFNAILCSRSYPQLRQVFQEYQNLTGNNFTKAIENEFSGDIKDGLLAIVKSVLDRPGYFAERLYESMKGFGTKDRTLQRIVIVRSEIDMADIKQSFQMKYSKSLEEFIKEDCSGDYKRTLVALVS